MTTKPIPFPGSGTDVNLLKLPAVCLSYGDNVEITFGDDGYLSNNNDHAFLYGLPSGFFGSGSVVFSSPAVNSDQKVTLSLLDAKNGKVYTCHVTVEKICPVDEK